ncbi:MAG TPA: phosphatase PAP2 family protein [Desulfuromonadaceae bacterium]|jgi:membrane-associated PAP2 superfamily phosphatase
MNRKIIDFAWPLAMLVIATALIALTNADLSISTLFYQRNGWPTGNLPPWRQLYLFGYYPAYILGGTALGLYLADLSGLRKSCLKKAAAYMVVLLLLGPGLLINSGFKDHWGRERPRDISQFGGTKSFQQPWQPGAGHGRSFPSGHGASAFYLAMPFFILRRHRPRTAALVYVAGMFYGVLMGFARIAQGGHFASDILWAWGVVHLTAVVLYYLMGLDRDPPCPDRP